ncbi:SDR family oxidoreductase [Mesobaculum littorinae]|uniref:SDR family oxidoreductase n=1 Tax=Mesobaculum littorinae TaxID=2486419 RepID=A0A438AHQ3_9RHOB|nr:SDR family oxidoreductase [Mesobaculum littorinae]
MQDITGRAAIVTGASSGIGRGIAIQLAQAGAVAILAARSADKLEALAAEITAAGGRAHAIPTDVGDESQILRLFDRTEALAGPPAILVNNAGIADDTAIEDLSLARWEEMLRVNLTSAFLCAREAVRRMKPAGGGRIVNIGSLSAKSPRAQSPAYTATKFAIEGLTKSLLLDGRDHGITACALHPGATRSSLAPGITDLLEENCIFPEDLGRLVVLMCQMPPDIAMTDTTILPVRVPFLGRG